MAMWARSLRAISEIRRRLRCSSINYTHPRIKYPKPPLVNFLYRDYDTIKLNRFVLITPGLPTMKQPKKRKRGGQPKPRQRKRNNLTIRLVDDLKAKVGGGQSGIGPKPVRRGRLATDDVVSIQQRNSSSLPNPAGSGRCDGRRFDRSRLGRRTRRRRTRGPRLAG